MSSVGQPGNQPVASSTSVDGETVGITQKGEQESFAISGTIGGKFYEVSVLAAKGVFDKTSITNLVRDVIESLGHRDDQGNEFAGIKNLAEKHKFQSFSGNIDDPNIANAVKQIKNALAAQLPHLFRDTELTPPASQPVQQQRIPTEQQIGAKSTTNKELQKSGRFNRLLRKVADMARRILKRIKTPQSSNEKTIAKKTNLSRKIIEQKKEKLIKIKNTVNTVEELQKTHVGLVKLKKQIPQLERMKRGNAKKRDIKNDQIKRLESKIEVKIKKLEKKRSMKRSKEVEELAKSGKEEISELSQSILDLEEGFITADKEELQKLKKELKGLEKKQKNIDKLMESKEQQIQTLRERVKEIPPP